MKKRGGSSKEEVDEGEEYRTGWGLDGARRKEREGGSGG